MSPNSEEEIALIKKIKDNDDIDKIMPRTKKNEKSDLNTMPLLLILGYLMGDENVKNPAFKERVNTILRQGVDNLHMMIELAMQINMAARMG